MPILASLATVPGREDALEQSLRSLRPQVDQLRVICHNFTEPPDAVREYADLFICEPDRLGSAAKMRWAREWTGLYLACDDDIEYPTDYAATMLRWVRRWKGKALVTCHGRILEPLEPGFKDQKFAAYAFKETAGTWINYAGGCALAFDTRLELPVEYSSKSCEEPIISVWAQQHRVPIWLVPHAADWLRYLLPPDFPSTIWEEERSTSFARRNAELAKQKKWVTHRMK